MAVDTLDKKRSLMQMLLRQIAQYWFLCPVCEQRIHVYEYDAGELQWAHLHGEQKVGDISKLRRGNPVWLMAELRIVCLLHKKCHDLYDNHPSKEIVWRVRMYHKYMNREGYYAGITVDNFFNLFILYSPQFLARMPDENELDVLADEIWDDEYEIVVKSQKPEA